jgi:peptide/nickel transport system substrate-binding protein
VLAGCVVYEGLTRLGNGLQILPGLASKWEMSNDHTTYTFHLNDAHWQDGRPVTSDDVKFTLLRVSAKYGPKFLAAGKFIKAIDTPDPRTVVIRLSQPFGPFLFSLACEQNAAILPEHLFPNDDILGASVNAKPVGSGPFKFTEWVRGDHISFARNDNYWNAGEPHLDQVVLKIVPDTSARVLALRAGDVDYISYYYFPLSAVSTFKGNKAFNFREVSYPNDEIMIVNTRNKPFGTPAVRQALLTALDRDFIVRTVFYGLGKPAISAIDSKLAGFYDPAVNYAKTYAYNVARARKLLDDAGFPAGADGTRFSLRLVFDPSRPEYTTMAQVLQRYWGAIGVKVVLQPSERAIMLKRVYTDYDFDVTLQNYTTSGDPALGVARAYTTDAIHPGQTFNNASGYSNPKVDELFAKGRDAATKEERAKYYFAVQEILARDLPTIPYYEQAQLDASSARLHGTEKYGIYPWWGSLWLEP